MRRSLGWIMVLLVAAGCGGNKPALYEDERGFRITPPAGWVERIRPEAIKEPSGRSPARGQRQQEIPLPPLADSGGSKEQLLARYDRLTAGRLAWLRISVADADPATPLADCLAAVPPGEWRREGEIEQLELAGLPAARVANVGTFDSQDYVNESVAVRKNGQVYVITASFPAADAEARRLVRQAVAGAVWK